MRSGFTLIELLTVIAIIGMLGAISITTVRGAIQSAKETQTRTTVAKIDSVITGIYEKYQYRRLDVPGGDFRARAFNRVDAIRDLLRCDMPCTYDEVDAVALPYNRTGASSYTPLQDVYRREISMAMGRTGAASPAEFVNLNAELLYLIVMNADPEARSTFSDREVADTDSNGLMEFVDGWGRPIRWMRWAPGLLYSDRQPLCYEDYAEVDPEDADPFDPLNVIWNANEDGLVEPDVKSPGWFLVPYVYSAGPDGEYGLVTPEIFTDMNDPFTYSRLNFDNTAGSPAPLLDDGGNVVGADSSYKDNIDNHTLIR
ncbi:MAG: type II secretion system protein [Thermoguttaceae bacterium]|nr:type II secretion system protein [Thermoguttaceae bacterium]